MAMTEQDDAPAPPVVAVVVTNRAGAWLEDCLVSLTEQDYPNLSILVVSTGDEPDILARVAAVAPSAYVRRLEGNPGFGPAANDVLGVVEGASFFAFCHDDVYLDPTAIRALVEEAFRSNAGVVGPKLVHWQQPERLQAVGINVDKVGVRADVVEPGELDQEQHDAVRDVFLLPGACTLVRADLFATLGGFDPAIDLLGEDLDLCWRAQVAGARVVVVPAARVQHRESLRDRGPDNRDELAQRHRLRTVLTSYGRFHLLRVLPQLVALTIGQVLHDVLTGHPRRARALVGAWRWNIRRWGDIRARRRALRRVRQLSDGEVRRLQLGGSVQVSSFLRGELHVTERLRSVTALGHELSETLHSGPRRIVAAAWAVLVAVFLVGTRGLLFRRIPSVGSIVPFDVSAASLLREFGRSWRAAGLGADAPQPTAFALLGIAGVIGMGLLRQVLVLGCIPAGWAGAWRMTKPLGSRLGRAAGLLVYAIAPLPYDALRRGSWAGLLLYAAAPWLLIRLVAACGDLPSAFGPPTRRRGLLAIVVLGILTALVAAFVPLVVVFVPVLALALLLGAALTGAFRRVYAVVGVAAGASVVAVVLHLPWTFDFTLPGRTWWSTGGVAPIVHNDLAAQQLLRFDTGGGGHLAFGWALPVAALLPLAIGRDWRFSWAVRCWCVALACWALAWAGGLPSADAVLAPGAAALAFSAGLGVLAFERDLRGYRFGWRQVASIVAAASVLVALVPLLGAALDGRFGMPVVDRTITLASLQRAGGRVLWVGPPGALPVAPFRLTGDLAYGVSDNGLGSITERWASPPYGSTPELADDLRAAARRDTVRVGKALATEDVHFVVGPAGFTALDQQLDLKRVDVAGPYTVFENAEWGATPAPSHPTSSTRALGIALQLVLWVAAVGFVLWRRRRT